MNSTNKGVNMKLKENQLKAWEFYYMYWKSEDDNGGYRYFKGKVIYLPWGVLVDVKYENKDNTWTVDDEDILVLRKLKKGAR